MNRIFFQNKGHTRKLPIPNVFPFKSVHSAPREFFDEPGLTLMLDPKLIDLKYYTCEFFIIINKTVETVQHVRGKPYLKYAVALGGAYNKYNNGYLRIESYDLIGIKNQAEVNLYKHIYKDAIDLVYEGIREFQSYFTRQDKI